MCSHGERDRRFNNAEAVSGAPWIQKNMQRVGPGGESLAETTAIVRMDHYGYRRPPTPCDDPRKRLGSRRTWVCQANARTGRTDERLSGYTTAIRGEIHPGGFI